MKKTLWTGTHYSARRLVIKFITRTVKRNYLDDSVSSLI